MLLLLQIVHCMYQKLQKFDIHWYGGCPPMAMVFHLRRVSDMLYDWKSCLLCYMKDVVSHCSIFFKWNETVRVRVLYEMNIGFFQSHHIIWHVFNSSTPIINFLKSFTVLNIMNAVALFICKCGPFHMKDWFTIRLRATMLLNLNMGG